MVLDKISLVFTITFMFALEHKTSVRYRDEILALRITPNAIAIGDKIISWIMSDRTELGSFITIFRIKVWIK